MANGVSDTSPCRERKHVPGADRCPSGPSQHRCRRNWAKGRAEDSGVRTRVTRRRARSAPKRRRAKRRSTANAGRPGTRRQTSRSTYRAREAARAGGSAYREGTRRVPLERAREENVADGDDVLVVKVAQDLELAQDALGIGQVPKGLRDLLDRHAVARVLVPCGADKAVRAGANRLDQVVARVDVERVSADDPRVKGRHWRAWFGHVPC